MSDINLNVTEQRATTRKIETERPEREYVQRVDQRAEVNIYIYIIKVAAKQALNKPVFDSEHQIVSFILATMTIAQQCLQESISIRRHYNDAPISIHTSLIYSFYIFHIQTNVEQKFELIKSSTHLTCTSTQFATQLSSS